MQTCIPSYYPRFCCIAGACRHSCCIGWEIDVDEESLAYYRAVPGAFGECLRENITAADADTAAHFCLGEGERCPFLNAENLCDIFIRLGEEHLCRICADHPRFRNFIGGRCKMGLGLACEAAGELILQYPDKVEWTVLEDDGELQESDPWEDEILTKRQTILDVLQDRRKSIAERVRMLAEDVWYGRSPEEWREFYLTLEQLEPLTLPEREDGWTERLALLTTENAGWGQDDSRPDTVWEQLLVYFVNRHLADAADEWDFDARLGFAVLSYAVIRTMDEGMRRRGAGTFVDLVELARQYSAEVEYSEDNTAAVMEELDGLCLS